MLFFQGVMFYVPHWMWKQWEEGKIRLISEGMRGAIMDTKVERQAKIQRLVQYLCDTMHLHNTYAAGYFFCEALNFVNVVSFYDVQYALILFSKRSFTFVDNIHFARIIYELGLKVARILL